MAQKTYHITDENGTVHEVSCDYMFDNSGSLVFRVGERGNSEIVATFASGRWVSCVRKSPDVKKEAA